MKLTLKNLQQQSFVVEVEPSQTVSVFLLPQKVSLTFPGFGVTGEAAQAEN